MVDLFGLAGGNGDWVTTAVWQHGGDNGCGNKVNLVGLFGLVDGNGDWMTTAVVRTWWQQRLW